MNRKVDLSISCYGEVKDGRYDIVALPWGATEPHNLHLPYMTDCILSHDVAVSAALMTPVIEIYRDILYYGNVPQMSSLLLALFIGIVFIIVGELLFKKLQKGFAENF